MKLKGFYSIISVLIVFVFSHCDNNESVIPRDEATFIHLYGGEFQDKGIDICALPDGRLAILASTTETPAVIGEEPVRDVVIILTDTAGKSSELYTLGKRTKDESPSSMVYHEGHLYIAGTTDDNNPGDKDFLFMKFSISNGSMTNYLSIGYQGIDETCYDNAVFENVSGENNTTISGIIMVGESDSIDFRSSLDIWVTFEGDSIGRNQLDGVLPNGRTKSVLVESGSFQYTFVAEESDSYTPTGQSIIIASNAFSNGRRSRSKKHLTGFNGFNYADKILSVNSNSAYLVDGYNSTSGLSINSDTAGLFKRQNDINFTSISTIKIDTLDMEVKDIYETIDNGYLLLGTSTNTSTNLNTIKLVKFNFNLNEVLWVQNFGTNQEFDDAGSLIQMKDGKIFFTAAVSFQRGESNTKIALYKTTADGKLDF